MSVRHALRYETLVVCVNGKCNQGVYKCGVVLDSGPYGLDRHIATIDRCVAREDAQRGGVSGHLEIGILEDIFVPMQALRLLVESREIVHLSFDFLLDLPGEIIPCGLKRSRPLADDQQDRALHAIALTQSALCLGSDVPRSGNTQARGPDAIRTAR